MVKATKGKAPAATTTTKGGTVEVCGVTFQRPVIADPNHAHLIPHHNPKYIWREQAFDFCMDMIENETPMLVGLPSTGKTSLPEQVAGAIGMPLYSVSCEEETTLEQIVGSYKLVEGSMQWVDGPLTVAMRNGYWFLLDEYDYANSGVLGGLNKVLLPITKSNPQRKLVLAAHHGEVVVGAPTFRIIAACNSLGNMQKHRRMFPNAKAQNHATMGRFKFYQIDFMKPEQETQLMMDEFDLKDNLRSYAAKFVDLANQCRTAFHSEEMRFLFQTRHLMYMFKHVRRHKERHVAAGMNGTERVLDASKSVLHPLCSEDEQLTIDGMIRSIFPE